MSLFSDITTLNSALQAFTYAQGVVSENIANSTTVGYTAETAVINSLDNFSGVTATGVVSTRNSFLYNQIYGQLAQQAFDQARLSGLQQLGNIFPEISNPSSTVNSLTAAISAVSADWTALETATPATLAAAQATVLKGLENLAGLFNSDANQLYTLQNNTDTQLVNAINQVNTYEDQILGLNQQIVSAGANQSNVQPLIDQREVAAEKLTALTGGSVNYESNGAMGITFNGGTLVNGTNTFHLGILPAATTPGLTDVGYVSEPGSSQMADVTSQFTTGTIGGLLYSRNTDIPAAIQTINEMASGIIQYSNTINDSFTAPDTTSNHDLFVGSTATNMAVSQSVQNNLTYIGQTRDPNVPGDIATMQAALTTFDMFSDVETLSNHAPGIEKTAGTAIDATQPLNTQSAKFANPAPNATALPGNQGAISINGVITKWDVTQSLNTILQNINATSGGAFYATLVTTSAGQYVHILSNTPLTIFDVTNNPGTYNPAGNLAQALHLSSVLTSAAPINNSPVASTNQVDDSGSAMNAPINTLALFTQAVTPSAGGTIEVDNNPAWIVNWNAGQTIDTVLANIQAAAPAGTIIQNFNAATQSAELVNVASGATLTPANPMTSFSIQDLTGNFTSVLNLKSGTNASKLFTEMLTSVSTSQTAVQAELTQATALVSATQALQNAGGTVATPSLTNPDPTATNNVNLDAQLAEAATYQNAYDAAVRMQYVIEDMLNFLITGTASSNSNSAPIGS